MALNTNTYGYVIDPLFSFCDQGGKTIANGYVRVFRAGTSTPVLTYRNFDGAFNDETIELDNSGRTFTKVIASKGDLYKVCVYDAEHSQEDPILTVDKVAVIGASVNATNIIQGLNDVAGSGWIKSVSADDTAEISLDATNVTSEVDTMVNATAASADYMIPLVHKSGSDPDKKITLGNIFKFVLNFIHSLTDTATEADLVSGNYFALDGSAGTKKLNSTTLLTKTAQNALAGNVAPAFVPNATNAVAGMLYVYNGKLYLAKEDYSGAWDSSKFKIVNLDSLIASVREYVTDGFHFANSHYVKSFSGGTSGSYTFPILLLKGLTYRVTNTGLSGQMSCKTLDLAGNVIQTVTNGISSGRTVEFIASSDAYGLALYWNVSNGSCTIECLDGIFEKTGENFAEVYDPNSTNAVVGKNYVHDGILYTCKTNTSGAWDSSKFFKTNVSSLVSLNTDYIVDGFHFANGHYIKSFSGGASGSYTFPILLLNGLTYRVTNTGSSQMTFAILDKGKNVIQNVTAGISNGVSREFKPSSDGYYCRAYFNANGGSFEVQCIDGIFERGGDEYSVIVRPQLAANGESGSMFNAETLTSSQVYSAFDTLIDKAFAPKVAYRKTPKLITKYYKVGRDASNSYDIPAYVLSKRDRFGWIHSDPLYAWKNGAVILYTDSCSPRIGDAVYLDDSRTPYGYNVSSYNSTTQEIFVNSTLYERDVDNNVKADVLWSKSCLDVSGIEQSLELFFKDGSSAGVASVNDYKLILGAKEYSRCDSFDYHTSQLGTIVLYGNEHGPQSDPAEPCITLYNFAKDFIDGTGSCEYFNFIKENYKIVIIPLANPYGLNNHTRNNANNVNINRNYDTIGWSLVADADKGSYAGDQNETQFIMNLVREMNPLLAIDVHCYGYETINNDGYVALYRNSIDSSLLKSAVDIIAGFGFQLQNITRTTPDEYSTGEAWFYQNMINGALIEMNAGHYASVYDGKQHSDIVMNMDYTFLLISIKILIEDM